MARQKTAKKQPARAQKRRRRALPVLLLALMLALGFFGWMAGSARVTRVRYADVYLPDLPPAFSGTTLMYVSDLNIRTPGDAAACRRLMASLGQMQPDILVLGGDYTAPTLIGSLNGDETGNPAYAMDFIPCLANFPARLGKFAVTGESDDPAALTPVFERAGVQLLGDACAKVDQGGESLYIAGLSDVSRGTTNYEKIGGYFSGDECVITVAHNPAAYIGVRVAEARGGGAWADMVLAGHNLGGQLRAFGRTLRTMPEEEARCLAGWYYGNDLPMLVSQGVGCRGAMLRLGTGSEVWMITLRRPVERGDLLPR